MKSAILTFVFLSFFSCRQEGEKRELQGEDSHQKVLIGEVPFSWLKEIHYRQNSNSPRDIVHGGEFAHQIFKLDSEKYDPVVSQWIGIKSLDEIVGKSHTYYRYVVTAELYAEQAQSLQREEEFDDCYQKHVEDETLGTGGKTLVPVMHFSHGKVFYVFTTDMSDSWNRAEVSRLRFSLLNTLNAHVGVK